MEYIFMSIDPVFAISTRAVSELRNQGRTTVTNIEKSTIKRVKSSLDNEFRFTRLYDLSRRLGLCARVCMSKSAGMDPTKWISNQRFLDRNLYDFNNFESEVLKRDSDGNVFNLTDINQEIYCSEYDRLYPHLAIERKIKENRKNKDYLDDQTHNYYFPSIMFIFRDGFKELIQINTTMHVEDRGSKFEKNNPSDGRYKCTMSVVTIRARIDMGEDQKLMNFLKTLCDCYDKSISPQEMPPEESLEDLFGQMNLIQEADDINNESEREDDLTYLLKDEFIKVDSFFQK